MNDFTTHRFDEPESEEEDLKKVPAEGVDDTEEEEPEDPFGLKLDGDDYSEGELY